MEITILGWYGTETLGDRAIFAGILKVLSEAVGGQNINLGSLYPFFSQRTLREDRKYWHQILDLAPRIKLFDSKNINDLDAAISTSDFVIMGGGPLMQIEQLFMIRYAFKTAKKMGKKTAVIGCGIGPLTSQVYKSCLLDILDKTDLSIFRDSSSLSQLKDIEKLLKRNIQGKIVTSLDPSVLACTLFKKASGQAHTENYIAVNLRKFPTNYSKSEISKKVNKNLTLFVRELSKRFADFPIRMIPMHYFHFGNDDREFLNFIANSVRAKNLSVQNVPLTLYQTMEVFSCAKICYGMRLHSVIFQTILNGNNFILDYTDPKNGKVSGFLKEVDKKGFYYHRYVNLQTGVNLNKLFSLEDEKFIPQMQDITQDLKKYSEEIRRIF